MKITLKKYDINAIRFEFILFSKPTATKEIINPAMTLMLAIVATKLLD